MYDKFANDFGERLINELGYQIPEQLQELAMSRIAPAQQSLDILGFGCCTGLAAPLFRPVARNLPGIDLAPSMIEKAAARNAYDALHAGEFTEIYRYQ
jgi:predicted TPR repeat methyltransferase